MLSLTLVLNQQFNVVFGINVDILQFSFQCSFLQSQETILLSLTQKVKKFFKIIFFGKTSIKKRPKGQYGIAWQRPTLAERKSHYHRR